MKLTQHAIIHFLTILVYILSNVDANGCQFKTHTDSDEVLMQDIQPLVGKRYKATDSADEYTYYIGICTEGPVKAEEGDIHGIGVLQQKKSDGKTKIVGRYTEAKIMKGTDWIILEYEQGDLYHSHCGTEPRRARIFISCDNSVTVGNEVVNVYEESNNRTKDCYYLFEMASSVTCEKNPLVTVSLSVGSILVIVLFCVLVLYIVGGFLYNRFVLGAKGMEQFPNYSFWQDFGNLQADGCNFVCRSGQRPESRSYKGIGDDQLQEDDERDDHLLPM